MATYKSVTLKIQKGMIMPNLRLSEFVGNKMIFVDPTDFRRRISVLWKFAPKAPIGVKGQMLNSSKWSLRTNSSPLVPGCTPDECGNGPREQTTIFTEISYSVQNKGQLAKDLTAHIANLQTLLADLGSGFPPKTDVVLVGPAA